MKKIIFWIIFIGIFYLIVKIGLLDFVAGFLIGAFVVFKFVFVSKEKELICFRQGMVTIHFFDENSNVCKCGGQDKDGNSYFIPTGGYPSPYPTMALRDVPAQIEFRRFEQHITK